MSLVIALAMQLAAVFPEPRGRVICFADVNVSIVWTRVCEGVNEGRGDAMSKAESGGEINENGAGETRY